MIKKMDVILIAVIFFLSAVSFFIIKINGNASGNEVTIKVDGELYGTYSLDKNQEILIELESGSNCISICDGEVYMKTADCPDGYCMQQGHIHNVNETIVCLPHRLVVEIGTSSETAGESDDMTPDAVSE